MGKWGERVKEKLRNWLQVQPAMQTALMLTQTMTFETSVVRNQIWYRGDASELDQLYKSLPVDFTGRSRFWAAAPENEQIRKIHSGLPSLIVDTLAYIVKADLDDVQFEGSGEDAWKNLVKESLDFTELVGDAIVGTLVSGDGAFKLSINTDISADPIVEFWQADRVEYVRSNGKIIEIDFLSPHADHGKLYTLKEKYGRGYVRYELFDGKREVPLDSLPELAALKPVEFPGDFIMAVPLHFYKNPKYPGRGKSIYETKLDDFDAFDEVISQWMDALRAGRVAKYIPEDMIPRNPSNGALVTTAPVNSFGTQFIKVESMMNETGKQGQIEVVQPEIRYDAFLSTYTAVLDLCLQGLISPATLGIDLGRMSSADAQREKKDVTGHTRNTITAALERALPELVRVILMTCDILRKRDPGRYEPSVNFGEYGAPSFDSRIETVGKAATANTMSIETQVDELWGSSKDDVWKAEEVARIKQLRGIEVVDQPAVGDELG